MESMRWMPRPATNLRYAQLTPGADGNISVECNYQRCCLNICHSHCHSHAEWDIAVVLMAVSRIAIPGQSADG